VYFRVDRERAKKVIFRARKENQNQIVEFQALEPSPKTPIYRDIICIDSHESQWRLPPGFRR
jgi:hypothetical protein